MNLLLVEAAKKLGTDKEIMDSYWAYHEREQNWFFSPNPNLNQASRRPASFDNWSSWDRLSTKQKMTLSTLAGFKNDATDIKRNKNHFSKLREAYISKWRTDLYSIFWANDSNEKLWLCNVFVGDAIYLCNGKNFTSGNNHYYDPKQIYNGQSFLKKRNSFKNVQAGDICVFGTSHVEIITKIHKNWIADDGFCSIGAGRGGNRDDMGLIKCDSFFSFGKRELDNDNHTYFQI
ncbi:hypothetical protein A8C32_13955 [Flavivirga aquatica]|uniref:DUF2272 domain-containing protein n=1 Tax=Flavivirga aquatica TaxID=1849968 RepID=A0A1E5TCA8_9FLAO|nr:hypothetical protein [Flavivirga aquatica]OEK08996.1 hypothetical protein A8C32_13955 [Flavivirga aquatica]